MCEVTERETENFLKLDPDPFDDRHPGRVDPDCALGNLLTVLFKKDDFMNQVSFTLSLFTVIDNYSMMVAPTCALLCVSCHCIYSVPFPPLKHW